MENMTNEQYDLIDVPAGVEPCQEDSTSSKKKGLWGCILAGVAVVGGALLIRRRNKATREAKKIEEAKELLKKNGYGVYQQQEIEEEELEFETQE